MGDSTHTVGGGQCRTTPRVGQHPRLHSVPLPSDVPLPDDVPLPSDTLPDDTLPDETAVVVNDLSITVHGQRMPYLEAGCRGVGPTVVLVHGLGGDRFSWREIMPALGAHAHVIAPDLLGFGDAGKPRHGDYSVPAHAARIRDLVVALGLDQVCLIGHSFGGGVAMSFAYQFPERTEMLGLVCSGGLGPEVAPPLRLATVPTATLLAQTVHGLTPRWLQRLVRHALAETGVSSRAEIDAVLRALDSLRDPAAREAYLRTLREAVHWSGQRLTATDRLYQLATLPVLLVAGRRDHCIPTDHTIQAHHTLPGSELAVLDTGHFPQQERPDEVAHLIVRFLVGLGATERTSGVA